MLGTLWCPLRYHHVSRERRKNMEVPLFLSMISLGSPHLENASTRHEHRPGSVHATRLHETQKQWSRDRITSNKEPSPSLYVTIRSYSTIRLGIHHAYQQHGRMQHTCDVTRLL